MISLWSKIEIETRRHHDCVTVLKGGKRKKKLKDNCALETNLKCMETKGGYNLTVAVMQHHRCQVQ